MVKIVLNMGTSFGGNITVIAEEESAKGAIKETKEAIKAFSRADIKDADLYRIVRVEEDC